MGVLMGSYLYHGTCSSCHKKFTAANARPDKCSKCRYADYMKASQAIAGDDYKKPEKDQRVKESDDE